MRSRPLLVVPALCLALTGCPSDPEPFPEGRWVAGDLHVHASGASNDTDGVSFPEDIAAVARARGLGFVVLTDHSNSTGSMDCADVEDCINQGPEFPYISEAAALSDAEFVMVDGSEISPVESIGGIGGPVGHTGCLPPAGGFAFDGAFIDRPAGEVTGGEGLAQCTDIGGFAVVNHPFSGVPWIKWDWTSDAMDGMEVWNGTARWDRADRKALVSWECMVSRGRNVVPIAGSDNHRVGVEPPGDLTNPPLGQPRTSVWLDGESLVDGIAWPAVLAALRSGRVVLHEPGSFVQGTQQLVEAGATWIATGTTPIAARVELRQIPAMTDCDWTEPDEEAPVHEVLASANVAPGEFEVHFESAITPSALVYLALTRDGIATTGEGDVAMTGVLQ